MAQSTKTTRTSARRTPEPTTKKRLGRPLGSKNKATSAVNAKAAPVARTTRAASRKTASPAAPKLSKAELEHQLIKLERTITRLRKQNAELKQAARTEARETAEVPPAPVGEAKRTPKRGAAPSTRRKAAAVEPAAEAPAATAAAKRTSKRSTRSKTPRAAGPAIEQEPSAPEGHDDDVDPEA